MDHGPEYRPANHARPGEEKVMPMQQQVLKDVSSKQVQMVTVDDAPGQESVPHVHPGSAFAFAAEVKVSCRLAGIFKYHSGESRHEPPEAPHLVSSNATSIKPGRLLADVDIGEKDPDEHPVHKQ